MPANLSQHPWSVSLRSLCLRFSADWVEEEDTFGSLLKLEKLEALSVALPQDKAFARQVVRKVVGKK